MRRESAVFPLSQAFLPGEWVSLRVFEPRYMAMLADMEESGRPLCSVLIERGQEVGGGESRMSHGVLLSIERLDRHEREAMIGCRASTLVSIEQWLSDDPYPSALVIDQEVALIARDDVTVVAGMMRTVVSSCIDLLRALGDSDEAASRATTILESLDVSLDNVLEEAEPDDLLWKTLWMVARFVPAGSLDRYELLRPGPLVDRTQRLLAMVTHVREVVRFNSGR